MKNQNKSYYAFVLLVFTGIMLGFARGGIMSLGGVFLPSVSESLNVQTGTLALYYSISALVLMVSMPMVGKLVGKVNIKTLIIASIILQGGSFAAFGLLNSVVGFYILAIPMAIGTAIPCHIVGPVMINSWFKKKNGIAMGVTMSISTIITILILVVSGSVISSIGWRASYGVAGIGSATVVIVIALLFIKFPNEKQLPYGINGSSETDNDKQEEVKQGVSYEAAKKSVAFYSMIIFMFLLTAVASFSQLFTAMALSKGFTLEMATVTVSIMTLGILIGSLVFGFLTDKLGAKFSVIMSLSFGLISSVMLLMISNQQGLYFLAMLFFGLMVSSLGTMAPLLVNTVFGRKDYAKIYSMIAMGLAVGGMVGTPLFGYIAGPNNNYQNVLVVVIIMIAASILSVVLAFANKKTLLEKEHNLRKVELTN